MIVYSYVMGFCVRYVLFSD